ncbi:MAG: hypothetical protein JWQ94_4976 [Tardiphaga sp.]|nr:hypothetical protein [Tardiphaga sp.]
MYVYAEQKEALLVREQQSYKVQLIDEKNFTYNRSPPITISANGAPPLLGSSGAPLLNASLTEVIGIQTYLNKDSLVAARIDGLKLEALIHR